MSDKIKLATVWLDGCSGCHMSFLDMDERIIEIVQRADILYSPLVDAKEFPEMVDVTLVEGSVSTDEDAAKIRKVRAHSRFLISLGDCAVTGNVPALRNTFGVKPVMERAYYETAHRQPQVPSVNLPVLSERVQPVHEIVPVDFYVPGCPPPADAIHYVLTELLAGRVPNPASMTRFGK